MTGEMTMTPDDIDVWVGLDVGKSAHHAHALDRDGNTLYDKPLKQDEKAIRTMLGKLCERPRSRRQHPPDHQ